MHTHIVPPNRLIIMEAGKKILDSMTILNSTLVSARSYKIVYCLLKALQTLQLNHEVFHLAPTLLQWIDVKLFWFHRYLSPFSSLDPHCKDLDISSCRSPEIQQNQLLLYQLSTDPEEPANIF